MKLFNKKTESRIKVEIKKKKYFRDNNSFFKWINENKELIKNVKVFITAENIRVIYEKM